MRIAYLTCVYPPYPGGIGVAAEGMAKEMAKRGHEVHVFTPTHPSYKLQATSYKLHDLHPWLRYGNAALVPQILWRLRNFDIVHILYPFYGAAEFVPLLRRVSRAKVVVHHMMDAVAPGLPGRVFRFHARHLMPRIFCAADAVLVLSNDYYHNSDVGRLGLNNVAVVPHGVDTALFKSKIPNKSQTNPKQIPIILFVGGLDKAHYFKGIPVLLEACRILKDRGVRFACEIAGEGDLKAEYERQADGLAEFIGLVPHDELPAYYQQAALCVVPSTERIECFSIVAAEAQACGVPVVVTDFPGVRVTIEDGVTGYVARPGDPDDLAKKIKMALDDPARAAKMGEEGRARAERLYGWKVVGDKLAIMYESLRDK